MLTIKNMISSKPHVSPPKAGRSQAVEATSLMVLVVDDHCVIREALCDLLKELTSSAIIMEAADGHRPALEVADIFRDHGPAWRQANAEFSRTFVQKTGPCASWRRGFGHPGGTPKWIRI